MNDKELRKAIECPARLVGCELEPDLTESLIYDFKNQPGALPLLQHALDELWKRRKDRRLTLNDYEGIGGLEGALEGYANSVYENFDEPKKKICQGVFLRLIQPGEGTEDTKRLASMKDLVSSEAEAGEELRTRSRTVLGKQVRQMRAKEWVPAVVYGPDQAARSLEVPERALRQVLRRAGDTSLRWISGLAVENGRFKFVQRLNAP